MLIKIKITASKGKLLVLWILRWMYTIRQNQNTKISHMRNFRLIIVKVI